MKSKTLKGNTGKRYSRKDLIFYCCLLALPLLQIAIFYFGVNIQSFFMAFQTYNAADGGIYEWDFATNFNRFISEASQSGFWIMVRNSFAVWILTSLAGTTIAVFFSYYIYKKRALYNFFKLVLFLPSILPGIMIVVMFRTFMGEAVPAFAQLLFSKEVQDVFTNGDLRFWVITLFSIWCSFGSQVLIYTGSMDQIPTEVIEAGKLDGAGPMIELFKIVIPYILPTLTTFLVAGIAGIFTNQNGLYSFVGDRAMPQDRTIGYYLYILVSGDANGKSGYCYASFLGLLSTLVALPLTYLARKVANKAVK